MFTSRCGSCPRNIFSLNLVRLNFFDPFSRSLTRWRNFFDETSSKNFATTFPSSRITSVTFQSCQAITAVTEVVQKTNKSLQSKQHVNKLLLQFTQVNFYKKKNKNQKNFCLLTFLCWIFSLHVKRSKVKIKSSESGAYNKRTNS